MRASETGSQVPTGTPGSGLPVPIEPRVEVRPREAPGPGTMALGATPPETVLEPVLQSVATAYCEREQRCRRVGEGDGARCIAEVRERYRGELAEARCPYSFDVGDVGACLAEIRGRECAAAVEKISAIGRCHGRVMCAPR